MAFLYLLLKQNTNLFLEFDWYLRRLKGLIVPSFPSDNIKLSLTYRVVAWLEWCYVLIHDMGN
ncbi:hypothetical protein GCM10007096_07660 [Pullulanibacillus pueri]|uniref:Uncharacterized protein n=1 Tax=Pullulanibacillus pueri TaxID=1437324 RepID=A0A8J2ZU73_9BACL|nr:hypothetical protein GCM10007096_07660 [Pullulanibacillus pueri]